MIPKRIAFFWGNDTMSWLRYMTLYSFCKLNPCWEVRLYHCKGNGAKKQWTTHVRQDFAEPATEDYWSRVGNLPVEVIPWELKDPDNPDDNQWSKITPPHKSDFFEWEYLANEGGIYADMDILFVKPMDAFLSQIGASDVAICHSDESNNSSRVSWKHPDSFNNLCSERGL